MNRQTKASTKSIALQLLKIGRLFIIIFKRRRKLEKISLGYYQNWHFDNAYLVIEFKFKNAVWFRIGKFQGYDFSKQIVLDLESIKTDTIYFEVFGFFQKQVYEINLNKKAQICTRPFKTKINNIKTFELVEQKIRTRIPKTGIRFSNLTFFLKKITMKQQNIQIEYNPFKIEEYI